MKKRRTGCALYLVIRGSTALALLLAVALALVLTSVRLGQAVRAQGSQARRPVYSVETAEAKVALGINCAWGNEDIGDVLAALETRGVKATFFIVGDWCDRFPEAVKRISDAGHEIGSHSDTHADLTRLNEAEILREIRSSRAKLEAATGKPVTLLRPPSGAYDNDAIRLIEEEGMTPVQWDCDSLDYRGLTAGEMQERIFKRLRRGSILLFHTGTKNTAAALPEIIAAIEAQGYSFVPVGELVHPRPYRVDFEGRQHRE